MGVQSFFIDCENVNAFIMAVDFCHQLMHREHLSYDKAKELMDDYENYRNNNTKHLGVKMHLTPVQFVYFCQTVPKVGRKLCIRNERLVLE